MPFLDQQIDPSNLPSDEKIFEVPDDKAFLMLGRIKEIVLVQDIGDDPNIVLLNNGQGRKIWVTSPNSSKLKNPLRENLEQRAEIYLSPWELDEVLFVNKHVFNDKWSTETLKQRFNLIGGNLRLLFFTENLMEDYQKALEEISYAELKQVLSSAYTDIPKGKSSGMFIHPVPVRCPTLSPPVCKYSSAKRFNCCFNLQRSVRDSSVCFRYPNHSQPSKLCWNLLREQLSQRGSKRWRV